MRKTEKNLWRRKCVRRDLLWNVEVRVIRPSTLKLRIHLRTLVRKLHRVQESIRELDVRVISTYKRWVRKQFVANHLYQFFKEHKGCSQFSGYDVHLQFSRFPRC